MRNFKILLASLALALTLTSCQTNTGNSNDETVNNKEVVEEKINNVGLENEPRYNDTVKIGYSGDLCLGAPNIANINGYFEDKGIDVEFVNTQNPKDALGTGKLDALTGEFAAMVVPATNGLDIVFSTSSHSGCKSLYVLNDSEITKTSELANKSVAVTNGIGNSGHNTALRFFNHDGVDPITITFKPVNSAAVIQALEKGEIDSVVLDDQFAYQFVESGKIRSIRSMTDDEDFGAEVCCVTAFNRKFADENPELTKLVAEAIEEANNYMAENPEDSTQILYDNNLASGDYDAGLSLMKSYDYSINNDEGEKTLRSIFDDYKNIGLINTDLSTDELMAKFWRPLGE